MTERVQRDGVSREDLVGKSEPVKAVCPDLPNLEKVRTVWITLEDGTLEEVIQDEEPAEEEE